MGKRGPKPKRIIDEKWSPDLAYAVGLLATDGCITKSHLIDLTSKDREQLENYRRSLGISTPITRKWKKTGDRYLHVQFKNVYFYTFLVSVGLTPAKSKTLGALRIPQKLFFDFLRGAFDGDGYSYSYWDERWKSSFMFYIGFASASKDFLLWIQSEVEKLLDIRGHITTMGKNHSYYQLKYAKADSFKILKKMYKTPSVICLSRKRLKIDETLRIVGQRL